MVKINNSYLLTNALSQWPMSKVHVFDIAAKVWFAQSTTTQSIEYPGGSVEFPVGRTAFCSVVASAEDNSSHNIYIYGGSDGSDSAGNDIWILTLPAFEWVLVYVRRGSDFRRTWNHRCHKIHGKHMVAYGGNNYNYTCDSNEGVRKCQGMAIYDMSSLEWTTKIEVENERYLVPERLYKIIGGG